MPLVGLPSHITNKSANMPAITNIELTIIKRVQPSIFKSNFFTIKPPTIEPNIAAGITIKPTKMLERELET